MRPSGGELGVPPLPRPPEYDWLNPATEDKGLPAYLELIRSNLWLVLLTLILSMAGAGYYLSVTKNVYQAETDLTVSPAPSDASTLGLGLIHESSDPTRDVATVARLVTTEAVAVRARARLGSRARPQSLLASIDATPVADTSIVQITAKSDDPRMAQQLANAFAQTLVDQRTERLHAQLDVLITPLTQRIDSVRSSSPTSRDALRAQLTTLLGLRDGPDPTLRLETPAELPTTPVSPRRMLTIIAAIVVGLTLGIGGIFTVQMLDPRLRREQQLRELYRLPILARISTRRSRNRAPLLPHELPRSAADAYHGLHAALAGGGRNAIDHRTVLITGASAREGKTTTSINLAFSLAKAGHSVVLIETDVRRPSFERAFAVSPPFGLTDAVERGIPLEQALVRINAGDAQISVLLTTQADRAERGFAPSSIERLLADAHRIADFVIIDSPPINQVPYMLPMAGVADDVVLVVQFGRTNLTQLHELAELLVQQNIRPAGFAVVGASPQRAYG